METSRKVENEYLIFPSRQCSSILVVFGKEFLCKDYMTTLEHPHLAAANFYLFPRLKSTLKRKRFCNAPENIKNATEELKRLSQNQEYFQHLYSH
jgi:hypothetical protein